MLGYQQNKRSNPNTNFINPNSYTPTLRKKKRKTNNIIQTIQNYTQITSKQQNSLKKAFKVQIQFSVHLQE